MNGSGGSTVKHFVEGELVFSQPVDDTDRVRRNSSGRRQSDAGRRFTSTQAESQAPLRNPVKSRCEEQMRQGVSFRCAVWIGNTPAALRSDHYATSPLASAFFFFLKSCVRFGAVVGHHFSFPRRVSEARKATSRSILFLRGISMAAAVSVVSATWRVLMVTVCWLPC